VSTAQITPTYTGTVQSMTIGAQQRGAPQVEEIKERFPHIKVSDIDAIIDRMLLIGPPGIGKTERIYELSIREAIEKAREQGKEFRLWCEYVDIPYCREKYGWLCNDEETRGISLCQENYQPPDINNRSNQFIFVDIRDLLSYVDKGSNEAKNLLSSMISSPSNFYVFQRIIAPHLRPEDIQIPNLKKSTETPGISFDIPTPLAIMTLPGIHGVLFIDELTNLPSPVHASMYFSIIQEREIGLGNKLSDKIKIVAAGNPSNWSTAAITAENLPEPLINRMVVFYVDPPTVHEWLDYMSKKGLLNESVMAYLLVAPGALLVSESELEKIRELEHTYGRPINFNTPRSWAILSAILNTPQIRKLVDIYRSGTGGNEETMARIQLESIVYGTIGPIRGREFMIYLKAIPDSPTEILADPEKYLEKYANEMSRASETEASEKLSKLIISLFSLGKYVAEKYATEPDRAKAENELRESAEKIARLITAIFSGKHPRIIPELVAPLIYGVLSYRGGRRDEITTRILGEIVKNPQLRASKYFMLIYRVLQRRERR
jgi:hypothetical protein